MRTKRVYSTNSELTKVWASQTKDYANTKNMFFSGNKIYSYGTHYLAAKIYKEQGVTLVNSYRYSVTTCKHLGHIYSAIGYKNCFSVPCPDMPESEENINYFINGIVNSYTSLLTKLRFWRSEEEVFNHFLKEVEGFNQYCNIFGLENKKLELSEDFLEDLKELIAYKFKKAEQRKAEKEFKQGLYQKKLELERSQENENSREVY